MGTVKNGRTQEPTGQDRAASINGTKGWGMIYSRASSIAYIHTWAHRDIHRMIHIYIPTGRERYKHMCTHPPVYTWTHSHTHCTHTYRYTCTNIIQFIYTLNT